MLEAAELGDKVSKKEYEKLVPELRMDLVNAQFDLDQHGGFPVIVHIVGDDRAGCNDAVHTLHEWMDARYLKTRAFGPPTEEERMRPPRWRYWRDIPRRGRIGIYLGGAVLDTIGGMIDGRIDDREFDRAVLHSTRFDRELAADGAIILHFWLHLPKKELGKRLEKSQKKKNPLEEWRVEEEDWRIYDDYDEAMPVVERYLRDSKTAESPWTIVESTDRRYRDLTIARTILAALRKRLDAPQEPEPQAAPPDEDSLGSSVLDRVDLSSTIERDDYKKKLDKLQVKLSRVTQRSCEQQRSAVLVFEGWDAAGKGGIIRRITSALHIRDYRLVPIAAPTEEERGYHYLWRFWTHIPRAGHLLIFDRSWYGRVLVERVEGFAPEADWRRAYDEINDFEEQLTEHGMTLLKFWIHIDPDEQLRRFKEREKTGYKKYKITDEDYRNREKWDAYVSAVDDMVAHTSTESAPWHLVPANDKRFARIQALDLVHDAVKRGLKGKNG